jgi:hypothetical protein
MLDPWINGHNVLKTFTSKWNKTSKLNINNLGNQHLCHKHNSKYFVHVSTHPLYCHHALEKMLSNVYGTHTYLVEERQDNPYQFIVVFVMSWYQGCHNVWHTTHPFGH